MELRNDFQVPAAPDEAWTVLLDLERVAACMPGFSVDSVADDSVSGAMNVKVGPMSMTYRGQARFVETDEGPHRVVLRAEGTEARGSGTAGATVTAQLHEAGDGATKVTVDTDLAVTGKPAQFGRGVLAEVGQRILDQFAAELSRQLEAGASAGAGSNGARGRATPAPSPVDTAGPAGESGRHEPGAEVDLAAVVARSVARRAWPVLVAVVVFAAGWVAGRRLEVSKR